MLDASVHEEIEREKTYNANKDSHNNNESRA